MRARTHPAAVYANGEGRPHVVRAAVFAADDRLAVYALRRTHPEGQPTNHPEVVLLDDRPGVTMLMGRRRRARPTWRAVDAATNEAVPDFLWWVKTGKDCDCSGPSVLFGFEPAWWHGGEGH
jgi:hypothetical protein